MDAPTGRPRLRLPGEWEPHRATWLAWPHNRETWPGVLERLPSTWAEIARQLRLDEEVRILVRDGAEAVEVASRRDLGGGLPLSVVEVPTDDAWVRDFGPLFAERPDGSPVATCWRFNAWGEKYPPWDLDAAAGRLISRAAGLPAVELDMVLEGGAVDANGRGMLLAAEGSLLDRNRRDRQAVEEELERHLGASHVIWLSGAIAGDDTDGHVDTVARFVSERTVVAAVEENPADANYRPLRDNLERLRSSADRDGARLEVVELPMPDPVTRDGARLPASYANFYIANAAVLVPVYRSPRDAEALGILRELFPEREVAGIDCTDLVVGLGSIHCMTLQEPAL
jgi:agmatine deiminase